MNNRNMTALVSVFIICYHNKNSNIKIYNDKYISNILKDEEYNKILDNMSNGIKFFNKEFRGTKKRQLNG